MTTPQPVTQTDLFGGAPAALKGRPAAPAAHDGASLAALQAAQRAKAAAVVVSDDQLAEWYATQCRTLWDRHSKLLAAVETNLKLLAPKDPRWPAFWQMEAKRRYVEGTLLQLLKTQHIAVCPNCGIDGCEIEAGPEFYEGLSLRGMGAFGESALSWSRYCTKCVPLGAEAKRLAHEHEIAEGKR